MHEEIRQQVYRVCAAIDRAQYQWLDSVFTADATIVAGAFEGRLSAFKEVLRARKAVTPRAVHMIGQVAITPLGPARAFAESYCYAVEETVGEDGVHLDRAVHLRYADLFDAHDGPWRISRRVIIVDHGRPATASGAVAAYAGPQARRDDEDPAVAMLKAAQESFA